MNDAGKRYDGQEEEEAEDDDDDDNDEAGHGRVCVRSVRSYCIVVRRTDSASLFPGGGATPLLSTTMYFVLCTPWLY